MAAPLALVTTILTSFLPILDKRLLRDARPALVAWTVNTASLPILAVGTLLLTQCSFAPLHGSIPLSCTPRLPRVGGIFAAALGASALLNWPATLLSNFALARADASLVSPLLTFNPAFTLLLAWPTLGEASGCIASRDILPNGSQTFEEQWQEEVIHGPSPAPISPAERTARSS